MARQVDIDLGGNVTLLATYLNPSEGMSVRADYSLTCGEDGEIHKTLVVSLPHGLEDQLKNLIKNFVIPQIATAEDL